MKRTGATGPHFHIGLDSGLASKYAKRMNYKYNPKVVPNYTMPIPGNHIGPALPPVENNIVPDKDLLAQSETIDQQNEKIAKLDYTWQNLMQQEADAAKAAAEAKLKAEKDRQRAFGLNLAMGIIDNMGARNQQTQGTYAQNFLTPFINNLYSLNTAAYGGPIVATANKFELGGPETKVINGKTLTHATVPRTGEVRWVDLNDSRDFDGVTGYRWYDDAGNRMSYTQYRESPSSETNASKELVPIKHTLSDNTVFGKLQGVIDPDTGNLLFPGDENYNKVRMGYARGFYNPFSGGELKNNQYRTMPTNEEASRFADQYVAATEFKPWHLVTAPAKGLDILAPSRWVGLMDDANDMGFSYLYDDRNPGFFIGNDPTKPFSKKFAQEHPYWAMAGNMVGDVASGYGMSKVPDVVGNVRNYGVNAADDALRKYDSSLNNIDLGFRGRAAVDVLTRPFGTYRAIRDGRYIYNPASLRRNIKSAIEDMRNGLQSTNDYYHDLTDVTIPEIPIRIKSWKKINGSAYYSPSDNTIYSPLTRSKYSNIRDWDFILKRRGGHEGTHAAEYYLQNHFGTLPLSTYVQGDAYFMPNINHPVANKYLNDFMKSHTYHGQSPEEAWADYMGSKAEGSGTGGYYIDHYLKEGVFPPKKFAKEYENYLRGLNLKNP